MPIWTKNGQAKSKLPIVKVIKLNKDPIILKIKLILLIIWRNNEHVNTIMIVCKTEEVLKNSLETNAIVDNNKDGSILSLNRRSMPKYAIANW